MTKNQLLDNINNAKLSIYNALKESGRSDSVTLIGATKTQSQQLIQMIEQNNLLSDVGENIVQEIRDKYDYASGLNWHMIGQLQSNKVKYIIDKVILIHSLDRLSLAKEIDKQAKKHGKVMDCLIEINMAGEINKGGIDKQNIMAFLLDINEFENIRIRGLMTVMPNLDDKEKLANLYCEFYDLFCEMKKSANKKHKIDILSCGMSNDFELAIKYGRSNMVRLGKSLFNIN